LLPEKPTETQRGEVVDVFDVVQLFLRSSIGEMLQWYSIISTAMIVFFQEEYLQKPESNIGSISTLIHEMMLNVIKHMYFFNALSTLGVYDIYDFCCGYTSGAMHRLFVHSFLPGTFQQWPYSQL